MQRKTIYVDATARDHNGNAKWQHTGIQLRMRHDIAIVAVGYATGIDPDSKYHDPAGVCMSAASNFLAPGLHAGALVGKVGASEPTEIGNNWLGEFGGEGELMLGMNDSGAYNNFGGYMVTIVY